MEKAIHDHFAKPGVTVNVRKVSDVNYRVNLTPKGGGTINSYFISAHVQGNEVAIVDRSDPKRERTPDVIKEPIKAAQSELVAERDDA